MAVLLRLLNILLGGRFPYHTVHHFFMFSPKWVLSPRTECSSAYSSKIRVNSGLGWKRARRALLHGPLELWQANSPVCVCARPRSSICSGFQDQLNLFTNSGFQANQLTKSSKQLKTTGKVQHLQGAKCTLQIPRHPVHQLSEPSHPPIPPQVLRVGWRVIRPGPLSPCFRTCRKRQVVNCQLRDPRGFM